MRLPKPITRQTLFELLYKDKVLVIIQAVVVGVVIIDFLLSKSHFLPIGLWYLTIIIGNGLLALTPILAKKSVLGQHFFVYLSYNLAYAFFLVFVIPLNSPYYFLSAILLYTSIHWFGTKGFITSYALMAGAMLWALFYQVDVITPELWYQVGMKALMIGMGGLMLDRMALSERRERLQLISVSKQAVLERKRLTSLINSMADAVIATDDKGTVVVYNGASLDLLNTNISLTGKSLNEFLKFYDENNKLVDVIKEANKGAAVVKRDDLHFKSNDGEVVRVYIDIAPIRFEETRKDDSGFIMLLRDITKEKSLDEERSEFISVTSHELRTPIAIAEANISTALVPAISKQMPQSAKDLLEQAHNQILFLADLVNDLTTLARAERNDLEIDLNELNAEKLLKQLAENYKSEAETKKLAISLEPKLANQTILTSELYVREVLQNFITNAIKYTEKGGITLGARFTANGTIIFSVKDTGIGIASTDKRKVFSKFYRAEDYRTRQTRGTGLGLYITLKLAERIRGRIWFDSKLNVGSVFYLEVPSLSREITKPVGVARRFKALMSPRAK